MSLKSHSYIRHKMADVLREAFRNPLHKPLRRNYLDLWTGRAEESRFLVLGRMDSLEVRNLPFCTQKDEAKRGWQIIAPLFDLAAEEDLT